jgi:hypothetical protein
MDAVARVIVTEVGRWWSGVAGSRVALGDLPERACPPAPML